MSPTSLEITMPRCRSCRGAHVLKFCSSLILDASRKPVPFWYSARCPVSRDLLMWGVSRSVLLVPRSWSAIMHAQPLSWLSVFSHGWKES